MKKALTFLPILCIAVFCSCSNYNGKKFIGKWKLINAPSNTKRIEIEAVGDEFVIVDTINGEIGCYAYKLHLGKLIARENYGDTNRSIIYIGSSEHIILFGHEWEKCSINSN